MQKIMIFVKRHPFYEDEILILTKKALVKTYSPLSITDFNILPILTTYNLVSVFLGMENVGF